MVQFLLNKTIFRMSFNRFIGSHFVILCVNVGVNIHIISIQWIKRSSLLNLIH